MDGKRRELLAEEQTGRRMEEKGGEGRKWEEHGIGGCKCRRGRNEGLHLVRRTRRRAHRQRPRPAGVSLLVDTGARDAEPVKCQLSCCAF